MTGSENDSKMVDPLQKRRIESLYYLYNRGLPAIKDESSFQHARQEFIALFPEFSADVPEKFDPAEVEPKRRKIRDEINSIPREERIWGEELAIRAMESLDRAFKALTQNMKHFFGEEFPLPVDGDNAIEAHERLDKKISELKINIQSLPLAEREEYSRAEMEVTFAWDVVLMNAALRDFFHDESTNPNELFCLMFNLGIVTGLLMNLDKDRVEILKDAYSRIKASEAVIAGRWAEYREDYEKAVNEADEYWKNGGVDFHHELAKKYAKTYFLKESTLKRKLIPIATKYNKVFGLKGVKKEK